MYGIKLVVITVDKIIGPKIENHVIDIYSTALWSPGLKVANSDEFKYDNTKVVNITKRRYSGKRLKPNLEAIKMTMK